MGNMYTIAMALQNVAIVVLIIELFYALCQKPSGTQKYLIMLVISAMIMLIGYTIEVDSETREATMMGIGISYIGKPYVMLFTFMFLGSYYGYKINKNLFIALLIFCASFPLLIFTNDHHHHLYYAQVNFDTTAEFSPVTITHGPLYYMFMVSVVVFYIACLWVVIRGGRNAEAKEDKNLKIYSIAMLTSGVAGYIFYILKITGGYDTTMLGISVGTLFLFLIFRDCRIFDLVLVAKEHALDNSPTALLVFDRNKKLAYSNSLAQELSRNSGFMETIANSSPYGNDYFTAGERIYSIAKSSLKSGDVYHGEAVELTDVTDSINYSQRLEHDIKLRTKELEDTKKGLIASIAIIVEARSIETGEHIKRTGDYTKMIAESLREKGMYRDILTDEYIDLLVSAAPLHDIGKISVPDSILLKPGKLTADEFNTMKIHSENGAKIIETSLKGLEAEEYIAIAADIARYHHERWDGKGYPTGKSGGSIPLSARIVALADSFDAISSKRCYKDAYSFDESIKIVLEESGTHFDPDIVNVFVEKIKAVQ